MRTNLGLGIIIIILTLLMAGLAAKSVIWVSPDDHHFMSAAYLLTQGDRLYSDFAYFQMPYAVYLQAFVLKAGFSSFKYLSLHLFNLLFVFVAIWVVYRSCKRLSYNRLIGMACALLFTSSSQLHIATVQLNTYAIANCFALFSFVFLTPAGSYPGFHLFLSGFFLAMAIGSKLYYLALLPVMLAFASWPTEKIPIMKTLRRSFIWLLGLSSGLAPIGFFYFRNPDAFIFSNLGYHVLNAKYKELTGYETGMTLSGKIQFLTDIFGTAPFLCILILYFLLVVCLNKDFFKLKEGRSNEERRILMLSLSLFVVALLAALTPKPLWNAYFLAPLPFALFTLAALWRVVEKSAFIFRLQETDIVAAALLVGMLSLPTTAIFPIMQAGRISNWETVIIHNQGQQLADLLSKRHVVGKVFSLENIFAIEGGLPIYKSMAESMFGYRIGDLMTNELRERCHIVSPINLYRYLDADPPSVFHLTGATFKNFEDRIAEYALARDYEKVDLGIQNHRLFIKRTEDAKPNRRLEGQK